MEYCEDLHGKMNQKRRENCLKRYKESKCGALMCTDVAARGLDVDDIAWVVQFDSPTEPSQFTHRVGRAARAGKSGRSLVFLSPEEEAYVDFLKLRKIPIEELGGGERAGEQCLLDMMEGGGGRRRGRGGMGRRRLRRHRQRLPKLQSPPPRPLQATTKSATSCRQ